MKASREVGVIQLIINYIKNDNTDSLQQTLDKIPIEKIDNPSYLLSTFLKVAASYDRPEAGKIIIKVFERTNPVAEKVQTLTVLFLLPEID
ncbi:unnamed protein product, partial [marine sediment metagenome]